MSAHGASPGATWQGAEMVGAFLGRRETLIPLLDVQEDLVGTLLDRHPHPIARFMELGSGNGAMSELVLSHRPDAEAVLVDFSELMLAGVGERLGDAAEHQVAWLAEVGFEQAQVHFKWAEACVFGAVKPTGGERDEGD